MRGYVDKWQIRPKEYVSANGGIEVMSVDEVLEILERISNAEDFNSEIGRIVKEIGGKDE